MMTAPGDFPSGFQKGFGERLVSRQLWQFKRSANLHFVAQRR
jgi:hypothetical protein